MIGVRRPAGAGCFMRFAREKNSAPTCGRIAGSLRYFAGQHLLTGAGRCVACCSTARLLPLPACSSGRRPWSASGCVDGPGKCLAKLGGGSPLRTLFSLDDSPPWCSRPYQIRPLVAIPDARSPVDRLAAMRSAAKLQKMLIPAVLRDHPGRAP